MSAKTPAKLLARTTLALGWLVFGIVATSAFAVDPKPSCSTQTQNEPCREGVPYPIPEEKCASYAAAVIAANAGVANVANWSVGLCTNNAEYLVYSLPQSCAAAADLDTRTTFCDDKTYPSGVVVKEKGNKVFTCVWQRIPRTCDTPVNPTKENKCFIKWNNPNCTARNAEITK